jgi:succinylglutamate desuccinylase
MRLLHEYAAGARELPCGKVVLAIGNEDAVMANQREVSHNLNRLFLNEPRTGSDPELVRARELQEALFEPGSLLVDLHSTSQESRPFVMVESSRVNEASWVPVQTVLCGTPYHWDRYLLGTTQCYARLKGVTAFTVECGQHDSQATAEVAYATAEAFLNSYLTGGQLVKPLSDRLVVEFSTVVTKEDETFRFARTFAGFDTVARGELLGRGLMGEHRAEDDCVIIFPTDPTKVKLGADLYFLGRKLEGDSPDPV